MKQQKPDYKTWLPIKNFSAVSMMFVLWLPFFINADSIISQIALSCIAVLTLFYGSYLAGHFLLRKNNFKIQHELSEALISKVPGDMTGNALDIGTGNGIAAIKLAKAYPNLHIFGIDLWSKKWDYSKKQCIINANLEGVSEHVAFTEGSGFDLPVKNASMALIISNYAIHTMKEHDIKAVFQEIIRALELNGYLVVQDFFRKRYYGRTDEFIKYLEEYGLHIVEMTDTENIVNVPKLLKILDVAGNSEIWILQKRI